MQENRLELSLSSATATFLTASRREGDDNKDRNQAKEVLTIDNSLRSRFSSVHHHTLTFVGSLLTCTTLESYIFSNRSRKLSRNRFQR
jgi:hypothetical protein